MQDIESLRDYVIADEIQRIKSLTHKEVVNELIDLQTKRIESLPLQGLVSESRDKNGI